MPTIRGYLIGLTGFVLLAVGRTFGAGPLEQLGVALFILSIVAVGVVRLGRHDLEIERKLAPPRVAAGRSVTVTVRANNRGRGAAPLLLLEDRVPLGLSGSARFALEGVEAGGHRTASFTLRAVRRGRYDIGPLEVSFVDPFNLARVRWRALEQTALLVHPRVQKLSPPRDTGERRSLASSARRHPSGAHGEEFYTLREYVEGDDLRKVHWGATAKRGRYMIRQEETPWHTRATVLLDERVEAHGGFGDTSSFEHAVEAAASLCDLFSRSGYSWRLMGAEHQGRPVSKGADHLDACLDVLATVELVPDSAEALLGRLAAIESTGDVEAALVLVTGSLDPETALALTRCKRHFRQVSVVAFPAHRFGVEGTKSRWEGERGIVEAARLLARSGVRPVVLGPGDSLATAWSASANTRREGEPWVQKPELV